VLSENYWDEFPGAVTICDETGIIIYMNNRAIDTFADDGGKKLIGTNVLDCHPEPSRTKLLELLRDQTKNVYTIEKKGVKKLIYQSPWYKDGTYAGIIELSLEIPESLPHFIRG
jgi:transcriptional regulator with PAS, ATPase and Fis domain